MHGALSVKNDVFAFGVVLLELISGVRAFDFSEHQPTRRIDDFEWIKYLLEHDELGCLTDPNLRGDYDENEAKKLVKLALLCVQESPTKRPTMSEAVQILKGSSLIDRWESEKEDIVFAFREIGFQSGSTLFDSVSQLDPEKALAFCQGGFQSRSTPAEIASHPDPEELSGPR